MIDQLYLTMVHKPKTREQSLTVEKATLNSFVPLAKQLVAKHLL